MNTHAQIYINVTRPHMEMIIRQQYDRGYLLIHSEELTSNKLKLTFEKCVTPQFVKDEKPIKGVRLDSSEEIPEHILDEVLKK